MYITYQYQTQKQTVACMNNTINYLLYYSSSEMEKYVKIYMTLLLHSVSHVTFKKKMKTPT